MKHVLTALLFTCLIALGIGPPARALPSADPVPAASARPSSAAPLRLSGRKLESCALLPGTRLPLCRSAMLPARVGRVVSAGPASFEAIDSAMTLIVDADRHAWLCLFDWNGVRCVPVAAPAPQNMDIQFWNMPGDYRVVTYTHTPGTPVVLDPGAQVTNTFQRALEAAAAEVRHFLTTATAHAVRPGTTSRVSSCDASVEQTGDCDLEEGPEPGDNNGDGLGGDWGWDNGPGPWDAPPFDPNEGWDDGPGPAGPPTDPGDGWDDNPLPDTPPWTDPNCDNGPCPGFGDDIPAMIPPLPRDPDTDTADLTPCDAVIPGIISICIRAQRPPPPVDEAPLPSGPRPWFPQSWCDFASLFCSNGQIQKSAESGKTLVELVADCGFTVRVKFDLCKIDDIVESNLQRYAECLQAATDEHATCVTRARDLTDDGAHPAP